MSAADAGAVGLPLRDRDDQLNLNTFPVALSILLLVGVVVAALVARGADRRPYLHPVLSTWSQAGLEVSPGARHSGALLIALMFVLPMGVAGPVERFRLLTRRIYHRSGS